MLISAHKLSMFFGGRPLFSDLTFAIKAGERIGLIGPNGAGKSTLLKILNSEMAPSDGELSFAKALKIGFLEQVPRFSQGATIMSTVSEGLGGADDWEAQSLVREFISRVGLSDFAEDTPIKVLSGGWKKRVALARALVKKPDLLLLDEPTNHMDVEGIAWLEFFLTRASFALMTITHDRLFLQRVTNRIIELDPRHDGGLLSVPGDYLKYLQVREQVILAQENRETVLKNTLRRETEWLRQGPKARSTKQKARIKKAGDIKQEVKALGERNSARSVRLDFVSAERNPKKLLEAKQLSKAYGEEVLFSNLDLILRPGIRIGLLGQNGAGKSSLIRTLLGQEEPTSGTVVRSEKLKVAYFDQVRETLDLDCTVTQTLCPKGDHVEYNGNTIHVRSYLDRFLFPSEQMDMPVANLSGGEQSRLLIASLMLKPANLLVLDEPTNDLDIATLNVLEACLKEFLGAVILVTHDRYFLDQVATELLAFPSLGSKEHQLVMYSDFRQWEERIQTKKAPAKIKKPSSSAKKLKLTFKEKIELEGIEAAIHKAEEKLEKVQNEIELPENASNAQRLIELSEQIAQAQKQVDHQYERWAELEKKQEEIQQAADSK